MRLPRKGILSAIRAYHGSPHDFDKFDMSKLGTGEGSQAFGHGLYFTGTETVAKGYRNRLGGGGKYIVGGQEYGPLDFEQALPPDLQMPKLSLAPGQPPGGSRSSYPARLAMDDLARGHDLDSAIARMRDQYSHFEPEALDRAEQGLRELSPSYKAGGHMYEVDINADVNDLLDYDRTLAEQPGPVKEKIAEKYGGPDAWGPGEWDDPQWGVTGRQLYNRIRSFDKPKSYASDELNELGIPGIRYYDGDSRGDFYRMKDLERRIKRDAAQDLPVDHWQKELDGLREGTSNYVTFDDDIVDIKRKYEDGGRVDSDDAELFSRLEGFARGGHVKKYGYGGDVEGGADEGVGGGVSDWGGYDGGSRSGGGGGSSYSSAMGDTSRGSFSDFGGTVGGSLGGASYNDGGHDYGSASTSGNYGGGSYSSEANFNDGSYGDRGNDSWGGNYGSGDGGFGANFGGYGGGFDAMGNFTGGSSSDVYSGTGGYGTPAFGDIQGTGYGGQAFAGMNSSNVEPQGFAGYSPNEFGGGMAGQATSHGFEAAYDLPDYNAEEERGPVLSGDVISPGQIAAMAALAQATGSQPRGFGMDLEEEEEDGPYVSNPATMNVNFSLDPRSKTSMVSPERRAGIGVALTEQLRNIAAGKTLGMPEVGVLAARAATGYGPRSVDKKVPGDRTTMIGQAYAPSQFSGFNVKGHNVNRALDNAFGWGAKNPERMAQVAAAVEDVIQGTNVPSTMGALSFSTPGRAGKSGNDRSMGVIDGHAFGNYSPSAAAAYAERVGVEDDNPAFDVPSTGPRASLDDYEVDVPEVQVTGLEAGPRGSLPDSTWADALGLTAQAGTLYNDRPNALQAGPNYPESEAWGPSVDLAAEDAAKGKPSGPVATGQAATTAPPDSWTWSDIAGMIGTGVTNLFNFEDPAAAAPPAAQPSAAPRGMPEISSILDDGLPAPGVSLDYDQSHRSSGVMNNSGKTGFVSDLGLPSSMKLQDYESPRPSIHEVEPARAGNRVAGNAVPTTDYVPDTIPAPSTTPGPATRPSRSTVPSSSVSSIPMPPSRPPPDYSGRGVVPQPNTVFHEKYAGKALDGLAGVAIPGYGIASLVGSLLGVGSPGSWLAGHSVPGIDLSRGQEPTTEFQGDRSLSYTPPTPERPREEEKKPEATKKEETKLSNAAISGILSRIYLGPPTDPANYGYGPERTMFKYARHGGKIRGALPKFGSQAERLNGRA